MSTENFVTEAALELALKEYEKISTSAANAQKLDAQFRKFFETMAEASAKALRTEVDSKLNQIIVELDRKIALAASSTETKVSSDILKKLDSLKRGVEDQISAQVNSNIQAKSEQLNALVNQSLARMKKEQEVFDSRLNDEFEVKMRSLTDKTVSTAQAAANEVCQRTVVSVSTQTIHTVETSLATYNSFAQAKFDEFTQLLVKELEQKAVDKERLLKHISSIEKDLLAKTQGIIAFQIEQARAMMEQSARAEMREGIRERLADVLTSLDSEK